MSALGLPYSFISAVTLVYLAGYPGVLFTEIPVWASFPLDRTVPGTGRQPSISAVFFQDLPEFRCQALVFIGIMPFHCG